MDALKRANDIRVRRAKLKKDLKDGRVKIEKIRVDLEPTRRAEMMQKSGRRTVPQIWIGGRHIGGCDDLYELERAGKLDPLLRAS